MQAAAGRLTGQLDALEAQDLARQLKDLDAATQALAQQMTSISTSASSSPSPSSSAPAVDGVTTEQLDELRRENRAAVSNLTHKITEQLHHHGQQVNRSVLGTVRDVAAGMVQEALQVHAYHAQVNLSAAADKLNETISLV